MTSKPLSVDIMLEEYKALRAEILLCLERRITLMSYGLSAIGITIAASVAALSGAHRSPGTAFAIFVFVPVIAIFILEIWFAETRRARRASQYLYGLEQSVNSLLPKGERGLLWEHGLRGRHGKIGRLFTAHYNLIVLFYVSVTAAGFGVVAQAPFELIEFMSNVATLSRWFISLTLSIIIWRVLFVHYKRVSRWLEDNFNRHPDQPELEREPILLRIVKECVLIAAAAVVWFVVAVQLRGM